MYEKSKLLWLILHSTAGPGTSTSGGKWVKTRDLNEEYGHWRAEDGTEEQNVFVYC